MKALALGALVWAMVSIALPYGSGVLPGFVLGALVFYLVSRVDDLARRVETLGQVPAPPEGAAPIAATPVTPGAPIPRPVPTAPGPVWNAAVSSAARTAPGVMPGVTASATPTATSPAKPVPSRPGIPLADLEALVAGRLLAVVGGLALLIGVVFFLGLAFSRGWIGPELRVAMGLVVGPVLFGIGTRFLLKPRNRAQEILALVLIAVGLAVVSLAFFAATRLYDLLAPEVAVGGSLLAAALASAVAIRARSQLVAGFGLIAVMAAPPIMGAGATLLTLVFLGVALAGTTTICLFTSWRWLPSVAFLLTVPQFVVYINGDPNLALGLGAVVVYWALNAVSAAGEEVRQPSQRLSETSATLLVASAAFATWAGFALMSGPAESWRGLYLVGEAAAHLGLGSWFVLRNGERHPFGMLVFGSGVAALTLAIPVQLGAPWVPIAWAAEAVALAWVYAGREHVYAGGMALALGLLSLGHLLAIEYPLTRFAVPPTSGFAFINTDGVALGFVTLAAIAAAVLLRRHGEQVGVLATMAVVVALVLPQELTGVPLVFGYALLTAGTILAERRWVRVPIVPDLTSLAGPRAAAMAIGERALYGSGALAAVLGVGFAIGEHLRVARFFSGLGPDARFATHPFLDERTLVAAIVAATALVIGFGAQDRVYRWVGCVATAVAVAYLVPFEVTPAWSVIAWLGLALGLHVLGTRWRPAPLVRPFASYAFAIAAMVETLAVVAPPDRLIIRASAAVEPAIFNPGMLAVAALTAALAARAFLAPRDRDARIAGILAGAALVYTLSIGTVDVFQARLGGDVAPEEIRKQAQVALSVLWAVLGVAGFVIGLVRVSLYARLFGLGLLALVTVKVFVIDLSELDVAYRVLSFLALGLLLLGAAYLATRFQPGRTSGPGPKPPDKPAV